MKCPYCAEEIQEEAMKCKHCGEWLSQKENHSYAKREGIEPKPSKTYNIPWGFILLVAGLIGVFIIAFVLEKGWGNMQGEIQSKKDELNQSLARTEENDKFMHAMNSALDEMGEYVDKGYDDHQAFEKLKPKLIAIINKYPTASSEAGFKVVNGNVYWNESKMYEAFLE